MCIVFSFLLFIGTEAHSAGVTELPARYFDDQFHQDISLLHAYVVNIDKVMNTIEKDKTLFDRNRDKDFDLKEKETLNILWGTFLDYLVAIESLSTYYKDFYVITDKEIHNDSFLLAYASYITKISCGLKFISKTIDNDLYEKKLDDVNYDYGIPGGMYAKLKWNTIHVQDVTTILAGYAYYTFLKRSYRKQGLFDDEAAGWVFDHIESQYAYIKDELKLKGPEYFIANGLDILKDKSFAAWFPVQMQVSMFMGKVKVKRLHQYLITKEQIRQMDNVLKPGDIIVGRRNWYISNVGLPGFWPHAELYIGTFDKMKKYFNDEAVTRYYCSRGDYRDFMDYLQKQYPEKMRKFLKTAPDGYPYQIIEAVSEGVKLSSLQEGTLADYIGVMRPRLTKLDISKAIDEAFNFLNRSYDFNFDFFTDSTIVCSELIYKIYQGGQDKSGIDFKLREIAGRMVIPPNDMVELFDKQFGTPDQELDFVYFLDGSEKKQKAFVRGLPEFRESCKRLKWDVMQK